MGSIPANLWRHTGGLHAIPKLAFPGGVLAGCSAGFLNSVKIKGISRMCTHGVNSVGAEKLFTRCFGMHHNMLNITVSNYANRLRDGGILLDSGRLI